MPFKIPRQLLIAATILVLLSLSLILTNIGNNQPLFDQFFLGAKNKIIPKEPREDLLEPLIQNAAASLPPKYAIYVKNLKTQKTYDLNSGDVFPSASIYKLAVMYKAYDAIEKGELSKDDVLSSEKIALDKIIEGTEDKNSIPSETNQEFVSLTVENALNLMITISDNYSALLLAQRLGWQNIDKFMETEGFSEINLIGPNSPNVTARSTGTLLEKIYRKEAVNKISSQEMLTLLFNQHANDRIPKYLPSYAKVGHKTGELGSVRHDVGIVIGKKADYIFVFLSETPAPEDASENIAFLSKKIFDQLETN